MRYDDFLQVLSKLQITIVPKADHRIRGYDVDTYRSLAKQTERMDFDCAEGANYCRYLHVMPEGCCSSCIDTCGHWQREEKTLDEDSAQKMAEYCDPRDGFCRDDRGCILPRELRSPVCLYHICSDAKLTKEDKEILYKLEFGK